MSALFEIQRLDGRSNAQVLVDYVKHGEPGRVYTYAELGDALAVGTSRTFDVKSVRQAVGGAFKRLLSEQARTLYNLPRVGYRLAHASEHMRLARVRHRRADAQVKNALMTLRHVRFEEMDENSRLAHQGQLMLSEAIWANQQSLERRQQKVEEALSALTQRVENLTSQPQSA